MFTYTKTSTIRYMFLFCDHCVKLSQQASCFTRTYTYVYVDIYVYIYVKLPLLSINGKIHSYVYGIVYVYYYIPKSTNVRLRLRIAKRGSNVQMLHSHDLFRYTSMSSLSIDLFLFDTIYHQLINIYYVIVYVFVNVCKQMYIHNYVL
jgi:hypothetical protein